MVGRVVLLVVRVGRRLAGVGEGVVGIALGVLVSLGSKNENHGTILLSVTGFFPSVDRTVFVSSFSISSQFCLPSSTFSACSQL